MATFIANTRTEWLKCRRTAAFWITVGGSAFIPLVKMISYIARPDVYVQRLNASPWLSHLQGSWQAAATFFLPMFVIIVSSLVVQIEYRNNTWKQVYASPRSHADIFFSKFCMIHLLIIGCFLLFNVFILLSGLLANAFRSEYAFFSSAVPWRRMIALAGKQYLAVLAMTAIQYWMSLRFRNYIAPLGIGLALLITGLIIIQWEKIIYYPYAYSAVTFFRDGQSNAISVHERHSMIWFVLVGLLAFWDTLRRKERG